MKVEDKMLKQSLNSAIENSTWKMEKKKDKVRKFDESVDFIINLKDINLKDPKQRIDKELILPNEVITQDMPNICVIASDEILFEANNMKIDTLNSEELVKLNGEEKKYKKKLVKKYDYFIVEDKMMRDVARYLARFLGPVGKMPKPFPSGYGIISSVVELKTAIERYKKVIRVAVKKHPIVQVKIGKKSMEEDKLFANMKAIIDFIADLMPHKYNNFKSIYIKTTMGHPVRLGGVGK